MIDPTNPLFEWGYTGTHTCGTCEQTFAVLSPEGNDPDFCPFCGAVVDD